MTNQERFAQLKVPGLRARMGDWVYYVTFLRLKDIAERVSLVTEIHTSKVLEDFIQREIDESSHSQSIKQYLLRQPQRFFNAVVIGVYGGSPHWVELSIASDDLMGVGGLPKYIEGALGILVLEGTEKLFAIDGQHRLVGIKRAIEERPGLGDEELTAIFIAHSNDRAGMVRTRRLFTTLNRYAKPVSKMEIIALDEDDVVAILTRRLLERFPLFRDFTSVKKGKNIQVNDRTNFTTIIALYDALDRYLATDTKSWRDFKRVRPSDKKIAELYSDSIELWNLVIEHFPPIKELTESSPENQVAAQYRNRTGGHLLFRPVGLYMIITVAKRFMDKGVKLSRIIKSLADVPMDLAADPWVGLLWDDVNKRMTVSSEQQRAATQLLYYGLGGLLEDFKIDPSELRIELAGLLGKEPGEVRLRRWAQLL